MKILHLLQKSNCNIFLRKNKDKSLFVDYSYEKIYPSVSKPATIYGLPKTRKILPKNF